MLSLAKSKGLERGELLNNLLAVVTLVTTARKIIRSIFINIAVSNDFQVGMIALTKRGLWHNYPDFTFLISTFITLSPAVNVLAAVQCTFCVFTYMWVCFHFFDILLFTDK